MKRLSLYIFISFTVCHAFTYLCKTKETFKLAELQFLEATLQASTNNYNVTKLLIDQATGSTLFRLDSDCSLEGSKLPTSLSLRCDWIAQVLQGGCTAERMIEKLRQESLPSVHSMWNLEYIRMQQRTSKKISSPATYTKATLLQAVSQALPFPPSINPSESKQQLRIVDTVDGCFLTNVLFGHSTNTKSMKMDTWTKRPFQYSSAINRNVAEIIMDILLSDLPMEIDNNNNHATKELTMLDPTMGSGTFLALAIDRGMRVEGYDCNPHCVDGSLRNLEFLYGEELINTSGLVKLKIHDSSKGFEKNGRIDCVVANLPWGINSVNIQQNQDILKSVRARIGENVKCAFVTGQTDANDNDTSLFTETGYEILGQAHVPQRDFILPKGNKKPKSKTIERKGRDQCVVTIAKSI